MKLSVSFKKYILPFLLSLGITFVLTGLLSLLFSAVNPPDAVSNFVSRHMYCVCAAISAFLSARKAGRNGLITGAVSGNISTLILILAGILILKNPFPGKSLPLLTLLSTLFGAIFGVIGINFKK